MAHLLYEVNPVINCCCFVLRALMSTLLSLLHDRFAVSDQPLSWFHSYLINRTQTFTTSSSQTSPLLLYSGVPQGSGLGPSSFLTYTEGTADIFSAHSLFYHLYAGDTQTYGHCSTSDILGLISRLTFCISDLAESTPLFGCSSTCPKRRLSGLTHDAIWIKYPMNIFHSPWDRLSSHALLWFTTLVFYWIVNYPWNST